ncbi:MAG: hypothetical protein ACRC10_11795 [Thermoguttaceae bacterium]
MSSTRSGREVDSALCKKGFERTVSGDHFRYYLYHPVNGAMLTQTKISHGMLGGTINAYLISQMSRQLRLTKRQFLALIDCTMSEAEYQIVLQQLGLTV